MFHVASSECRENLLLSNTKNITKNCIDSIIRKTKEVKYEIILVDDGSTDGTAVAVKDSHPEVNIIQGDGNLFWNRGMHLAWKSAANTNTGISIRALRGASSLGYLADGGLKTGTALLVQSCSFGLSYLDSPATTSATVYKTEFFEGNALSSVSVQGNYETSTIILLEIGA